MDYKLQFTYLANGKLKTSSGNNDDFSLDIKSDENSLKIVLTPNTDIRIQKFFVTRKYDFSSESKFFANGFQSWSDTKEFAKEERMAGLGLVGKSLFGKVFGLNNVGDYNFVEAEKEAGKFHSHSFAYVRNENEIDFFGSLTDRTGYTLIYADMNNNTLSFSKDLEGVTISEPYEILDLFFDKGEYDGVFDRYFEALGVKPLTDEKIKGYTSWYNYYQNISEEIILRDLNSLYEHREYVNTYQIDDGYQTAVGDWFSINSEKFPNGMKVLVDAIHEKGFTAGLWLTPFGAQKGSMLAKNHPDWLIKDSKGKPIPVGANWGGFYALDIYNEDARNYIKSVFNEVLNVWGFDLVKLDFLYAAAIIPMYGKSRGEIAYDSIELLRECVGDKKILGCGVQQMPCFGKVEYMRIGPDMSLGWKHTWLRNHMHREDVSTPNAIYNSIFRRCLNGRAFLCDPDVFLLRRTNIKFTPDQQKLLGKFIKLFGGVLFMSDNVAEYDSEQLETFRDILTDNAKITAINVNNNTAFIDYVQDGKADVLKFNVTDGTIY
ncbi:MAG: alpha-galactosidase [Eubacterium sp.]|nr:alpha-galactosidase [Eubacterium sp.]